jgi:hypothetical protein
MLVQVLSMIYKNQKEKKNLSEVETLMQKSQAFNTVLALYIVKCFITFPLLGLSLIFLFLFLIKVEYSTSFIETERILLRLSSLKLLKRMQVSI